MRNTILLSKEYISKEEVLQKLKQLGEKYQYRINDVDALDLNDIDFYRDISDEETYSIGFWVIDKSRFFEDVYEIDSNNYYISIFITHHSEMLSELNILLKDIMTQYPEMNVTDEFYEDFYNIEDINSGNIAAWLKE
ncbi:hypothetical protein GCM10011344_24900 [Dokdonia pacifica]|uniref:Uncharacterized protein n=1 Tax=Dokdonia pacifica TaxID=1627892 RepID=A0A238WQ67_9FLAO|nr:hypothetical protein [Dokdonia pacifica]GGG23186.1 hypothetical protein GCM10011344_24900 [Dokdonia pacifica]SNR48682.1 hypothetical protein SAMN06265376_1011320 [Dokdonia pacifica]